MEINITKFFNEACPKDYSASCAELGDNAGKDTWNAACDDADDYNMLDTDDKKEAFKNHVRGFGAWDDAEIAAWTDTELNALFIQMVSGDIRDSFLFDGGNVADWEQYEIDGQEGIVSGKLFNGGNGEIYYYIGE